MRLERRPLYLVPLQSGPKSIFFFLTHDRSSTKCPPGVRKVGQGSVRNRPGFGYPILFPVWVRRGGGRNDSYAWPLPCLPIEWVCTPSRTIQGGHCINQALQRDLHHLGQAQAPAEALQEKGDGSSGLQVLLARCLIGGSQGAPRAPLGAALIPYGTCCLNRSQCMQTRGTLSKELFAHHLY